jgi:hypothetical protein
MSHPRIKIPWGFDRELRKTCFFSSDGFSSSPYLSSVRRSIQRQPQGQGVHLSRPVLQHGLCSDYLLGEPAGTALPTLPHWNQGTGFSQHLGQLQQGKRLADLCGLCAIADYHGPQDLQQRRVSGLSERDRLSSARHDYRFAPEPVTLGVFPQDNWSYQTPYPVGSTWQYPVHHPHLRWKAPRGQHSGYHSYRDELFLYHGQGPLYYARLCCPSLAAPSFAPRPSPI